MALADYYLCDVCSRKTFYDASLNYDDDVLGYDGTPLPNGAGDMRVLCEGCAKTHQVVVVTKAEEMEASNG